jgi:hypothetical protein
VPVGIAGSPCLRGPQICRPGPPGWVLGMGLTDQPCKNPIVRKSKEEIASGFDFREGYGQ